MFNEFKIKYIINHYEINYKCYNYYTYNNYVCNKYYDNYVKQTKKLLKIKIKILKNFDKYNNL